jgi:hypothetical protein
LWWAPLFRLREKARSRGRSVCCRSQREGATHCGWCGRQHVNENANELSCRLHFLLSWVSDGRRYENEVDGITTEKNAHQGEDFIFFVSQHHSWSQNATGLFKHKDELCRIWKCLCSKSPLTGLHVCELDLRPLV